MPGMMHPTVGMNGMQGGFPQEGVPLSQAMQQPAQQFIPAPGMQQPQPQMAGFPQYQPGNVPINGQFPQQYAQQQQQQAQQPQPHPTAPYGQFFNQQPQPQSQQGFVPQIPAPQRLQVQGQEVLDGAAVPIELRGRTVQQVMQIYNTLAERAIQQQRQQQGLPQQQSQAGQPQQPQVQQPVQQPGQSYWQNPAAATAQQVGQVVQQQIQPLQEYVQRNAIRDAQMQAAQSIPDFAQLQEHIAPIIAGADPRVLADPQFWEGAADLARGRAYRQAQMQQRPQQPQQQVQRFAPAYQLPQPTYSFFSEGPTPPMAQYSNMPGDLNQEQMRAAQGFGMTPEMYRAWQGGVQQQSQNGWRR